MPKQTGFSPVLLIGIIQWFIELCSFKSRVHHHFWRIYYSLMAYAARTYIAGSKTLEKGSENSRMLRKVHCPGTLKFFQTPLKCFYQTMSRHSNGFLVLVTVFLIVIHCKFRGSQTIFIWPLQNLLLQAFQKLNWHCSAILTVSSVRMPWVVLLHEDIAAAPFNFFLRLGFGGCSVSFISPWFASDALLCSLW